MFDRSTEDLAGRIDVPRDAGTVPIVGLGLAPVLAMLLCFDSVTVATAQGDSALVARAQRTPVRSLDSTFATTPFAQWIGSLRSSPSPRVHWEVNDCGEGGDGRRAPTCVEAILALAPDTTARVSLIVVDREGKPTTPGVFMLYAVEGKAVIWFKTLAQWAAFVVRPGVDVDSLGLMTRPSRPNGDHARPQDDRSNARRDRALVLHQFANQQTATWLKVLHC